jgi:pyridoxamine 5'-phosphate oxidase
MSSADLPQLREVDMDADPLRQFQTWFAQVLDANLPQPYGMTLATAAADGTPSARMVLLRGLDERGFVFFTNYDSRKGQELAANPRAALVFYWPQLDRQVRIEGQVEVLAAEESDRYFATRPRESQLSAWASPQSEVIASRKVLERRMEEVQAQFAGGAVPRPPRWGGYRVVPTVIEFWQGRPGRLHDRLCYQRRPDGSWRLQRLAP